MFHVRHVRNAVHCWKTKWNEIRFLRRHGIFSAFDNDRQQLRVCRNWNLVRFYKFMTGLRPLPWVVDEGTSWSARWAGTSRSNPGAGVASGTLGWLACRMFHWFICVKWFSWNVLRYWNTWKKPKTKRRHEDKVPCLKRFRERGCDVKCWGTRSQSTRRPKVWGLVFDSKQSEFVKFRCTL